MNESSSSSSAQQICSVLSYKFTKAELEEMVKSACLYDNIDPKLQMIIIDSFAKNDFEQLLEKNNIRCVKSAKKLKGYDIVKDPRFGWGPPNHTHYLSIPKDLSLRVKVLGYLG